MILVGDKRFNKKDKQTVEESEIHCGKNRENHHENSIKSGLVPRRPRNMSKFSFRIA